MRNLGIFVSAAAMLATAGCVETMDSGYPATSYGSGYSNGYYSQPSYYNQPTYSSRPSYYSAPQVVTQTRYVPVAVPTPAPRTSRMRDSDRDGIPDRYDRDKNGDGVPDKYQRR
ncbi:MAG: thrombospondin type 3 repeat-containing protein [Reyranella sp.]|nr:thrombospondin type 3 repeat-containing protein [Reyranella sp.]